MIFLKFLFTTPPTPIPTRGGVYVLTFLSQKFEFSNFFFVSEILLLTDNSPYLKLLFNFPFRELFSEIYTLFAPFPFIVELENVNKAWFFFDFMCPIIPFLNTVAINLNTITIIVSSLDRLIEIICPLRSKLSKKNAHS